MLKNRLVWLDSEEIFGIMLEEDMVQILKLVCSIFVIRDALISCMVGCLGDVVERVLELLLWIP